VLVGVSVPLRGKGSVELYGVNGYVWLVDWEFPSPCGERVLLNSHYLIADDVSSLSFRPLAGKGFC